MHRVRSRTRFTAGALVSVVLLSTVGATGVGATNTPTLNLNELNNGHTFVVSPGEHVTLTLHSTYWHVAPLTMQRSVRQIGSTSVVGVLPGTSGCVPGQGCGTVRARYVALAPGLVRLRATRTSCGEALRCSPAQSSWTALLRVH